MQTWIEVNLSQTAAAAAAAAAEEAMAAASAAVAEAAAAAATAPHLPLRLSLHLCGPLVVLIAPPVFGASTAAAARRGAIVLRFGDLRVTNAIISAEGKKRNRSQKQRNTVLTLAHAQTIHHTSN